jgi:hypothetical protein
VGFDRIYGMGKRPGANLLQKRTEGTKRTRTEDAAGRFNHKEHKEHKDGEAEGLFRQDLQDEQDGGRKSGPQAGALAAKGRKEYKSRPFTLPWWGDLSRVRERTREPSRIDNYSLHAKR